jgi:hypothetical protein
VRGLGTCRKMHVSCRISLAKLPTANVEWTLGNEIIRFCVIDRLAENGKNQSRMMKDSVN